MDGPPSTSVSYTWDQSPHFFVQPPSTKNTECWRQGRNPELECGPRGSGQEGPHGEAELSPGG